MSARVSTCGCNVARSSPCCAICCSVRHGYAIGTALLSAHRLREIHGVVSQAAGRLADPTAQDLLRELEQRLAWGGIAVDGTTPVRAFANRSIVSTALVRPDSLAAERQAEALETAIVERRRIELERYASVGSFADSPNGSFRVWPLQLHLPAIQSQHRLVSGV